ncbi:MAG: exodeoxyribonuclease VII large subunit [Marinibacterium sp.]|nr:exodeoxyribonuclease VII large subunit [Marinibacterium sp.]
MDLIDDPQDGQNAPEFTVTELSGAIKRVIEGEFAHVRIRGEVGRVSRPKSGHVYLDLKDDRAVIAGVMWKGVAARLTTQPEEGMEVVATGRLTTFPGQSRYQIVIDDIKPAGMGALMALLEKRKAQLAGEGLFAPERKRPLPYLPQIIGVVTSPSGAVIRDILHRLRDRFPRKVLIWPVAVQGERCAPEVTRAIEGFNALTPGGALPRPDLLIVARGGGSVEDLWGFNEESVVRAAAASQIPLISAVGHETDVTLIDYASDKRAPTPTAAAELAVPVRAELLAWLESQGARLTRAVTAGLGQRGQRLSDLGRALPRADTLLEAPRQRLDLVAGRLPSALLSGVQRRRVALAEHGGTLRPAALQQRLRHGREALDRVSARLDPARLQERQARRGQELDALWSRFDRAATRQMERWRSRIASADRMHETLSYKATLDRGYAVVRGDDAVVTTRAAAGQATRIEIEFSDGRITLGDAGATDPEDAPDTPKPKRAAKPRPKPDAPEQGSLF